MAPVNIVPPERGHAPSSSAPRMSQRARWGVGALVAVLLSLGVVGLFVSGHWAFVVLALLGLVGGVLLLPRDFPLLWFRARP